MMKKIFIYLFTIAIFTNIYAQDKEPVQHKFYFPAYSEVDSVYLSDSLDYFKQKEFMLGWHWGASKKISKALDMNQIDAHSDKVYDTTEINPNTLIILKSVRSYSNDSTMFYTHCDNSAQLIRAKSIYYEPTLQVSSFDTLNTTNFDNMNPIFGFKGVRGRVENDSSDHRSRLVLDDANLNEQVVLDEPWMSGNLFRHDKSTSIYDYYNIDYLGYEWYITINIRRNNPNDYSYSYENILKIEMPYILGMNADSALIVFDSIPYSYPLTTTLPNNRGIAQRLDSNRSRSNYFYIKNSMLPYNCKDITISARFKLNGEDINNPKLKDGMVTYFNNMIDTLKIRVTYYNTCAVALDFIRIETPNAQRYFRGFHDDKIISSIQTDLINFSDETLYQNRGIKLFRFNSFIEGSYQDWAAERYFNKLIGNTNVSEDNYSILPQHFEYFVNPPERWLGTWQIRNVIPAPYSRRVYDNHDSLLVKTMGIINGYNGRINGNIETDSSKVHYETYLVNQGDGVDLNYF